MLVITYKKIYLRYSIMSIKYNNTTWNIIEKFFYDNPQVLVKHHISSYNDFFRTGVKSIFKERNPVIPVSYTHLTLPTTPYV